MTNGREKPFGRFHAHFFHLKCSKMGLKHAKWARDGIFDSHAHVLGDFVGVGKQIWFSRPFRLFISEKQEGKGAYCGREKAKQPFYAHSADSLSQNPAGIVIMSSDIITARSA